MKAPVLLFVGDEKYLKEKAIDELKTSFSDGSAGDLDCKVFYANETPARDILDYVKTLPFLSSKRLVIVKEFEKLPEDERSRLISYIKKPPKNTYLVLDAKDDSILKEDHDLGRYVDIKRFDRLTDTEVLSWIRSFITSKGKRAGDGAIEALAELQGANLVSLSNEIEKIITYAGDRDEISLSDVEETVGRSAMSSTFDLVWAIGENSADKAVRITADLASSGKKAYEVIGLLCWHFKRLLHARSLADQGESNYSIANALRVNKRSAGDFFRQMRAFNIEGIKSRLKVLLEADLDIKTTKYNPALILEIAVIRLCLGR